jgi:hypothetical protein
VDCKVIYFELVWRNVERDRAEGVNGFLLSVRTEV